MLNASDFQARFNLPYTPSAYQVAIFNEVMSGRGNLVVEAVAGSGKSSTLEIAARLVRDCLVVAFNKPVATSMDERLKRVNADAVSKTAHSHGFAAVRYNRRGKSAPKVEKDKYFNFFKVYNEEIQTNGTLFGRPLNTEELASITQNGKPALPFGNLTRLLDLARLNLVNFDDDAENFLNEIVSLCDYHGLDLPAGSDAIVSACVQAAGRTGRDSLHEIDYTDMVWLPVVHGWQPKRFSWLFVDECQDISPCILALLLRSIKRGGRMLFVGDRRQAIYGFAGADAQSFHQIVDRTRAKLLPLSVCYRCPTSVLDLAREFCPQIEARENAPQGEISNISLDKLTSMVRENDMLLCRRNAPLVSVCFSLIAEGIAATIKGRDIGKNLVDSIKKISKRCAWNDFGEGINNWERFEIEAARKRGGNESRIESRIQGIQDKAECIRIVYSRSGANDLNDLVNSVNSLFSDGRSSVVLSTIHKAKGLENGRIFILGDTQISFKGQQAWQREQENNLTYVAYTRAMEHLIFVSLPTSMPESSQKFPT